jgi:hypothetical protein
MSDLAGTACVGDWQLFDSTDPVDHMEARSICLHECPVRSACQELLKRVHKGSYRMEGTWAGQLFILGKAAHVKPPNAPLAVVSGTPERKHWASLPDCDHCGAKAGTPCRSPAGSWISAHRARLKVGCQDCGKEIGPRRRVCSDCAVERNRASWRASYRRKGGAA